MVNCIECTGTQCVREALADWVKYYKTEADAYGELFGMPGNTAKDTEEYREAAVLQRLRGSAVSQMGLTRHSACNRVGNCGGVFLCGELLPRDEVFRKSWFDRLGEVRGKPPEDIGDVAWG